MSREELAKKYAFWKEPAKKGDQVELCSNCTAGTCEGRCNDHPQP